MPPPGSAAPTEANAKQISRSVASAAERARCDHYSEDWPYWKLAAHPAGATPKEISQALGLHLTRPTLAQHPRRCWLRRALRWARTLRPGSRIAYVHRRYLEA